MRNMYMRVDRRTYWQAILTGIWLCLGIASGAVAQVPTCGPNQLTTGYAVGATAVNSTTGTVTSATAALGAADGNSATLGGNSALTLDMGTLFPGGNSLTFSYRSNDVNAPLQVLVATSAAGPYTNIAQLPGSTTLVTSVVSLPVDARYVQLATTSTAYYPDAVTYPIYTCVNNPVPTCAAGQTLLTYSAGAQSASATAGGVTGSANANGPADRAVAVVNANASLILNMESVVAAGNPLTFTYYSANTTATMVVLVAISAGGPYTNIGQVQPSSSSGILTTANLQLPLDAQFVQLQTNATDYLVDAVTYPVYSCVTLTSTSCASGQQSAAYATGAQAAGATTGTVTSATNITGAPDGTVALLDVNSSLIADMGSALAAGTTLTFSYSSVNTLSMQIGAATTAGGPYTFISSMPGNTTATTWKLTLPVAAQYIKMVTNAATTFSVDAITYPIYSCIAIPNTTCATGQVLVSTQSGAMVVSNTTGTVASSTNVVGIADGNAASLNSNSSLTVDMGSVIDAGNTLTIKYVSADIAAPLQLLVATSSGGPFTNIAQLPASTTSIVGNVVLPLGARFIQLKTTGTSYSVDAITQALYSCVTDPAACAAGQQSISYPASGATSVYSTTGTVSSPANATGVINATYATLASGSTLTLDLGSIVAAGNVLSVTSYSQYDFSAAKPMQVLVATNAGGPYASIGSIQPNTSRNTTNLQLPVNARYVQLVTPAINSTYFVDGVNYLAYACFLPISTSCAAGQQSVSYEAGAQDVGASTGAVTSQTTIIGVSDGTVVSLGANSSFTINMGSTLPAGTVLKVYYSSADLTAPMQVFAAASATGPFTLIAILQGSTTVTSQTLTLPLTAQYIQLKTAGTAYSPDAITYPVYTCVSPPSTTCLSGQALGTYTQGAAGVIGATGTVSNTANATGSPDGNVATLITNASITLDMGSTITAGDNLLVTFSTNYSGAPMQVLVSTNAGGPYTNIGKLLGTASATTQSIQLPINARYVRFLTPSDGYWYWVDAVTYPVYSCVSLPSTSCGNGQTRLPYTVGAQGVTAITGTVSNTANAIGLLNGTVAGMSANSSLILNMGSALTAGNTLNITYMSGNTDAPLQVLVSTNAGGPFTNIAQLTGSTTMKTLNLRLPINAQYVQLQTTGTDYSVDAVTQTLYSCVDVPVASCPSGQVSTSYQVGAQTVGATTGTVSGTANMIGVADGNVATISANSSLTADLGSTLSAGTTLYFTFSGGSYTAPLQVLAAATAGGPYTTIAQLSGGSLSTALPVTLLFNIRYIQLQTTGASYDLDAITYPLYTCVPLPGTCVVGQQSVSYPAGAQGVTSTTGTVSNGTNLLGLPDGAVATVSNNSTILLNLGTVVAAGNSLQVTYSSINSTEPLQVWVATNQGGPYTNIAQLTYSPTTITATVNLPLDAQYVKLQSAGYTTFSLDAVTYSIYTCVNNPATLCSAGQQVASYTTGAVSSTGAANVASASAATGTPDGLYAAIGTSGSGILTLDLGTVVAGGNTLNVKYTSSNLMPPMKVLVAANAGGPYTTIGQLTASTTAKTGTVILPFDARYVQLQATQFSVDAVTRAVYTCVSSTITSGMVYVDSDIDGKLGSTEQGVGGVTVQAYDAAGHLTATTTTSYGNPAFSIPAGYYSFNNLIAGQPYKLEFSNWPSQYTPSAYGLMNGTSVQFVQGVSQNNNLGVYMPSMVCSYQPNARMITAKGYYATYAPTAVDSYSYPYTGITNDISYLQIGVPLGMASQRPNNWVYMAPLWTNMPAVFPQAPDGPSAIYIASYNNPNGSQSYQGVKLLVKLSDLGINVGNLSTTVGGNPFGVQGLGGLAFSQSGDTLYAVNMSNGKLVQVDVSNADYTNPPATSPTAASELTPPPSLVNCSGGVYRPTALAQYGGKIYMGGVCDASTSQNNADLQGVVMAYDPSTQTWSKALNYPINFTAGSIATRGLTQVGWATSGSFQPVLLDLAFADNGEMVIGTTNRLIYGAATSSNQYGYIVGAWPNGDGTYTLENGGKLGPYTSGVTLLTTASDGPGNRFFFQQSTFSAHYYTYEGGLYIKSGTNEVAGGFTDLVTGYTYGVGYLNLSTGVYQNHLQLGSGVKITRTLGFDQVCDAIPPIEIGNRVWKDTNGNGIQDAGEPALAGVTVELRYGNGSLVATAVTDTYGNYIFSNQSGITNTISQQYGLPLTQLTAYKLVISSLGTNSSVAGLTLTDVPPAPGETAGSSNSGGTIDNNDAFLVSGLPTISLKTGVDGLLNHTYDFGLVGEPCNLTVSASVLGSKTVTTGTSVTFTTDVTPAGSYTYAWSGPASVTITSPNAGTVTTSGLPAGVSTFTVTVTSKPGCFTTATVSITAITPTLTLNVTPGSCNSATNGYDVTGTISLTAAVASTLTITDGSSITTVSIAPGQTSASFVLTGLASNGASHTVTVSGVPYSPTATTYSAPVYCACNRPQLIISDSQTVCQGSSFALPLSTTVVSNTITSAQWYFTDVAGTSFTAISGATSLTFSPTSAQQPTSTGGTRYYAITAYNTLTTCSATSFVNLTVKPTQTITFQSPVSGAQFCGNDKATFTVQTNAVAPDGIKLMAFTTATDPYSTTAGAVFSTSVASSTATGTKTFTFSNVQLPDNLIGTNYNLFVYAMLVSPDGLCQPTASLIITIKPRPIPTIGGPTQVCTGSTATLSANVYNGATYQWFLNNGTTSVSTANPYTTTAINAAASYQVVATQNNCVSDAASFTVTPVACNACTSTPTSLGGTTFRDFNGNGVDDTNDPNLSGITITLFRCDATSQSTQVAQMQTDLNGAYSFTGLTAGTTYRVEFSNFPASYQPTYRGRNNGTTVQFTQPGSCTTSLGLNQAVDYCQDSPRLVTACFVNGTANNTTPAVDAVVSVNYLASGSDMAAMGEFTESVKSQVGSVWGLAYSRSRKQLYAATFLKRHVGVKGGLGDIYEVTADTPADGTLFVTIPNAGTIGSDAVRGLGAPTGQSLDTEAFGKVGRVGLGGIGVSQDEKTLFVVNLADKKLYTVDIDTKTILGSVDIPGNCNLATGQSVPFGLKVWRGKVYIGTVCDASISKNRADLAATVFVYDPVAASFSPTPVLSFPLNYLRGPVYNVNLSGQGGELISIHTSKWHPWTDTFNLVELNAYAEVYNGSLLYGLTHPTPVLSDMEFDQAGNMILGFFDRMGHQIGTLNRAPDNLANESIAVGGDILKARFVSTTNWAIEPLSTTVPLETFTGENFLTTHQETSQGGLQYLPGANAIAATAMDPLAYNTGGFIYLSNSTGAQIQTGLQLYANTNGTFGKANGLGDITMMCDQAPIQIGNRVWRDDNQNGIQDPCEPAIPGAVVTLYDATKTTAIASVTTNAAGEYYFSSTTITAGNSTSSVATTALTYNTSYAVVVTGLGTSTVVTGLSLTNVSPLTPGESSTANSGATQVNNDAVLMNGKPTIMLTTGSPGSNNHTYDFGLAIVPCSMSLVATPSSCQSATNQYTVTGTVNLTATPAGSLTVTDGTASTILSVVAGQSSAAFSLSGLTPGTGLHTVTLISSATTCGTASMTYTAPASCSTAPALALSVSPGACSTATNQYSISGTISLTAAVAGSLTLTDGISKTTVSVTAGQSSASFALTGLPSGTASHTVTVSGIGYSPASTIYTAPQACTIAVALTVTPGNCQSATNQYSLSGTLSLTNAIVGTATLTDGVSSISVSVKAGDTSVQYSLSGLNSGTGTHMVTLSYASQTASVTYTAPASCSVAPVCSLSATATAGLCASATNTHSATVVVSLTNTTSGTLTITLPGSAPISQTIAANTPTVTGIFQNLISDGVSHTATISLPGCGTTTATFTAPVSCSVAPVCSISAVASAGTCDIATNTYSVTALVTVQNPVAGGTVSVSTGGQTITFSTTAVSQNTFTATFNGLISDGASHAVLVSLPNCGTTTATYTAPASCSVAPVCSISAVATAGQCSTETNTYSTTVTVTMTNPSAGTLTVTNGVNSVTIAVPATLGTVTAPAIFNGLISDGTSHIVTASLPGCSTATTTYTAPASCTASLALTVTPGTCSSATNQYSISGTLSLSNAVAGTATITDGTVSTTVVINTGATSVAYNLTGLLSTGVSHTVTVTYSNKIASVTYTAPVSCSVATALALTVTPGNCNAATNQYTASGTISLTAAVASTLTLTDGTSTTTIPITDGQSSASFLLTGLNSGTGSHTVTVNGTHYPTMSMTYTAPGSCSVNIALSVTPGACLSATNQYAVTGALSLTNAPAGTATLTDGLVSTTVLVGAGASSVPYSLTGLPSGTGSHTVTVSFAGQTVSTTYTAPVSCSVSASIVVTSATVCYGSSATLVTSGCAGTVSWNTGATGPVLVTPALTTLTNYTATCTLANASTTAIGTVTVMPQANLSVQASSTLVTVGTPVSISAVGCTGNLLWNTNATSTVISVTPVTASQTYSATCTTGLGCTAIASVIIQTSTPSGQPKLDLIKLVDKSIAQLGDILTYTLVLTNTGTTVATNTVVRDSSGIGLQYIANSATAPVGTTFSPGNPIHTWTISTLSAGQSLSLIIQARADSTGILYNTATIPGDTARVCTSVPVHMCVGDKYTFELTAQPGRSDYKWYRNGIQILGAITHMLSVTASGTYSVVVDGSTGECPDFSCCPFIVEEDSLPSFKVVSVPASCVANTPQANGQLILSEFKAGLTYQYSLGVTFNELASISGAPQAIPANGVIVNNLVNPATAQAYTIRVYNASGCYQDMTVLLMPTVCGCPVSACVPFVIIQTKRPKRIGDSR